jgi:hypothetical protein
MHNSPLTFNKEIRCTKMPINYTLTKNCNAKLKNHATLWGIQIMYVKIEVFWCGFLLYYEDSLNTLPYFFGYKL